MPRKTPYGWQNIQPAAPVAPGTTAPAVGSAPPSRKWRRLALAGLLVGGLSGLTVLVVLLLSWSEYPNLVVIAPRPQLLAVPDASGAGTTADALATFCRAGQDRPRLNAPPILARDDWKKHLSPARGGGLVAYFAAAGAADADGPFLWWPSAGILAEADKLRVADILAELNTRSGPKLLVFDLTPGPLPWASNGACGDFAAALKGLNADVAAVPDLAVVCSADAGETAWHWDAAATSVFGHYFVQAIQGAGREANDLVTADRAFDTVAAEVNNWARKQRAVPQQPLLLPTAEGPSRAKAVTLAKVPPAGYTPPARPTAPPQDRAALEREWAAAETELTHAERHDPEGFKQYLGWRLRWEQLVRDNVPVPAAGLPTAIAGLRSRLARGPDDMPFVTLAVPQPAVKRESLDIERLWKATDDAPLRAEWKRQTDDAPRPEHVRRAAELLCDQLDAAGYTAANLRRAVRVLDVVEVGRTLRPVETHLLRMFAHHLGDRPDPAAVKRAVALRRTAEQAAWAGQHGSAFRWTRDRVEDADRIRRRGEDLLFAGDTARTAEAVAHFADAEKRYADGRRDAGTVAEATAARDAVLVRLPFYARWVADSHRTLRRTAPDAIAESVRQVEVAFRAAHQLDRLLAAPPADPVQRADVLAKLKPLTADATAAFQAVVEAYEAEVTTLLTAAETQPENWHALDAAAAVPFLSAERRGKLFDKLERVTRGLDVPGVPLGPTPPPTPGTVIAARHVAVARALLGGAASDLPPTDGDDTPALRDAADQIGRKFRSFPDRAKAEMAKVADANPLTTAEGPLAEAARQTRLADPSAPVAAAVDPVLADGRYWRHRFLLWQAERAIADGWADVGTVTPIVQKGQPINTNDWYATRVAAALVGRARVAVLGLVSAPTSEQTTRLTADCDALLKRRPGVVTPTAAPTFTIIADYPRWTFGFDVAETPAVAGGNPPAGHPTLWVELPEAYREANPGPAVREAYRGGGTSTPRSYVTPKKAPAGSQKLASAVLHRGHLAKWTTAANFTGDATLEYVHVPPTGDARFAVVADDQVIGGAVVILIDRSASMKWTADSQERKPTRTSQAVSGLRKLLDALPVGTPVTVGGFHLSGDTPVVEPIAGPVEIDETDRWEKLRLTPSKLDALPRAETPVAWGIQQVLDATAGKPFWPANFAGARSLVVLTDGEDNFDTKRGVKPADTVLRAVTRKDHDTRLHLVLFAMDAADEKGATAQFESLENPTLYPPGKLPVKLWPGVKDGDEFAARLKDQFRPRVSFTRAGGKPETGVVTATVRSAGTGDTEPSRPLPPGEYRLASGVWEGLATLAPGDHLLLKVRRGLRAGIELTVPPAAYDRTPPPLRALGRAENPLRLSVPRVGWEGRAAALTVAMEREPAGGPKARRLNRPLFPWLDVTDPAHPGTLPRMTVRNAPDLVAPAWAVTLPRWDTGADQTVAVKMPAVTAFWIDPRVTETVAPTADGKFRPSDILEVPTEVAKGLTARKVPTNDGPLIVLEVDYQKPGRFPYLQTAWGDAGPPQAHRYYDPQHRYTATFGPLSPDQEGREIGYQLYAVADLRRAADSATVELPPMTSTDRTQDRTVNLRFAPPKQ